MGRIGFCCKFVEPHPKKVFESVEGYNTGVTTVAWLNRQTREAAEERLWSIMVNNLNTTYNLVSKVAEYEENRRMVRLSSDILPMYTENSWSYFWRRSDVINHLCTGFGKIGELARRSDVRLSFHPGQFTVLASADPNIVGRSIAEFEYHVDMARWMGYGNKFQDFKINVHISGKQGPEGIRRAYSKLSTEARNTITIENEENVWGLDSCLELADLCPIVLDIHHCWINSGEYIQVNDARVQRVQDSWRGVRPAMHYSVSREDLLADHSADCLPDMKELLAKGYKKQQLRAHSDFYWNTAVNQWASSFAQHFDIQCESKAKNLASAKFAKFVSQN